MNRFEKLDEGRVYRRPDGSRFVVIKMMAGSDHVGYVRDISGDRVGAETTEDAHTFDERGIVFDSISDRQFIRSLNSSSRASTAFRRASFAGSPEQIDIEHLGER